MGYKFSVSGVLTLYVSHIFKGIKYLRKTKKCMLIYFCITFLSLLASVLIPFSRYTSTTFFLSSYSLLLILMQCRVSI